MALLKLHNAGHSSRAHNGVLHGALLLSVGLHACLLLVQRGMPTFETTTLAYNNAVDVVLVNAHSEAQPDVAQAIAQASLDGGGQSAPRTMAASNQAPAARKQSGANKGRVGDSDNAAQTQLMQAKAQELAVLSALKNTLASQAVASLTLDATELREARQARLKLLEHIGRIEQAIALDNASPKRQFISPATRAAVYAMYYDQMRLAIEARGTRNFPSTNGRRLYGSLVLAIGVDAQGRVRSTRILQAAKEAALNQRTKALIAGMRFAPFDAALAAQASELVVVTQFNFLRDNTLATELLAPQPGAPNAAP
jgi:periplasmic protein TonB